MHPMETSPKGGGVGARGSAGRAVRAGRIKKTLRPQRGGVSSCARTFGALGLRREEGRARDCREEGSPLWGVGGFAGVEDDGGT